MTILTWIIRFGHVAAAATWLGGYMVLAFVIAPSLKKGANESFITLSITLVRLLTYIGTLTIGFGLVLIMRTRGFANLFGTLWGSLIITGFIIGVALLGIGDGALRPAIKRSSSDGEARVRLWSLVGFVLTLLAIGVMTGATYVF